MDYNYPMDGAYYADDGAAAPYQFIHENQLFVGDNGYPPHMQHLEQQPEPGMHNHRHMAGGTPQRETPARAGKRQARAPMRALARAKTPWTADENTNFFRALAEYTYADRTGLRQLVIYLNPSELDHVEHCEVELKLGDTEISQSLYEQEAENNPNRGSHLLFAAMRHMQRASGGHSIRVVNEKAKNVRSRIANRFASMFNEGALPPKRPGRYVTAMLNSIVNSPHCPVKDISATMAMGLYATAENKHDVSLWLTAMLWLHPRRMYEFLFQCAVQVLRAHIEATPLEARSSEDMHLMTSGAPDEYVVIDGLRRLVGTLNSDSPTKPSAHRSMATSKASSFDPYGIDSDGGAGRKRKRRLTPHESMKRMCTDEVMVPTNGDERIALNMFDLLKNEERLQLAGKRIKMVAAVGGVVRNSHPQTPLDVKYHLYRLWTCVARLAEVSKMLVPAHLVPPAEAAVWPRFAEFVVVHDYSGTFDIAAIEPGVRVSKTRMAFRPEFDAADLIAQWIASTIDESRPEIPMWLTVARRIDGEHVLALVISALHTATPTAGALAGQSLTMLQHRRFSDDELAAAVDTAIANGGNSLVGGMPMCQHGGLDAWPWADAQHATVSMAHGQVRQIQADVTGSSIRLVLSTTCDTDQNIIDPWMEPRVMASGAFERQKGYAAEERVGESPSFDDLVAGEQKAVGGTAVDSQSTSAAAGWRPMLETGSAVTMSSLASLGAPELSDGVHSASKLASAALMSSYASSAAAGYGAMYPDQDPRQLPPMLGSASGMLFEPTQPFQMDMLGGYADAGWVPHGFDAAGTYPTFYNDSGAPSEYGPP
ncbi:hypothetical protein H4R21_003639 [Coemansia helicoidea]|uniref:Uncharacterized protein n=1 Tax=Coemansia helicoidea TaxID=1286919 RepID=A0ACC1L0W9_9FUNG|nr:hypothetical protein H4R21_003639 [Coemansia helicoidea]